LPEPEPPAIFPGILAEKTVEERVADLEQAKLGTVREGDLLERVRELERHVFGKAKD
jgi:hypothetical protein